MNQTEPFFARTPSQVRRAMQLLELRPSRRLGQNFLIDPSMAEAMIADLPLESGETVLEIGPGLGALTAALLTHPAEPRVFGVEKDLRLADWLRRAGGDVPGARLRLLTGDFLRVVPEQLGGLLRADTAAGAVVVGNLPYSVSTPIIMRMAELFGTGVRVAQFLLQLEMAERLIAKPGAAAYGAPTARLGLMYSLAITRRVPRNVFYPRPDVESAVVRLRPLPAGQCFTPAAPEWPLVQRLITAGFSQRRKKAARLCAAALNLPGAQMDSAFLQIGLPVDVRAERIAPAQWIELARTLIDGPTIGDHGTAGEGGSCDGV